MQRRQFISWTAVALSALFRNSTPAAAASDNVIDVKEMGAIADGIANDRAVVARAIQQASPDGGTVYFPPGEYFLGDLARGDIALSLTKAERVSFVGRNALLSCRSVSGTTAILMIDDSHDVVIDGLSFKDRGFNRAIDWQGAVAVSLGSNTPFGTRNVVVRDSQFESVLSAVQCRGGKGRVKGIELTNLTVVASYYGFNFQNNGDNVVGRGLLCRDVKRSYFPYGVRNHDVEIVTTDNKTGFTDILVKCYTLPTTDLRIKARSIRKGAGTIVELDNHHESGSGLIRNILIDLDVTDTDCMLHSIVGLRSFTPDPDRQVETETRSRWEDITLLGNLNVCGPGKILAVGSNPALPATIYLEKGLLSRIDKSKLPKNIVLAEHGG